MANRNLDRFARILNRDHTNRNNEVMLRERAFVRDDGTFMDFDDAQDIFNGFAERYGATNIAMYVGNDQYNSFQIKGREEEYLRGEGEQVTTDGQEMTDNFFDKFNEFYYIRVYVFVD